MLEPLPYNITPDDIEFAELIKGKEAEFELDFERNFEVQEQTLQAFRASIELCDFNGLPKTRVVWNAAGYINIISFDLKIIAKRLFHSKMEWEKRYFARQTALLIHEGITDLFELFGQSLRKIIDQLPNSLNLKQQLKELTKRLNEYRTQFGTKLNQLRNFSIAHRDKEFSAQLNVICSISWIDTINFTAPFDAILNDAGRFMQQVLSYGNFDL